MNSAISISSATPGVLVGIALMDTLFLTEQTTEQTVPSYCSTMFLTHLELILFMSVLEWKALMAGQEPPEWAYEECE